MVGHFLHQNRKSRTGSASTNGSSSSSSVNNVASLNAVTSSSPMASSVTYQPSGSASAASQGFGYYPQQPNAAAAPPRYAAAPHPSPYDMSTMQYNAPQHLTAEAVAALPPPGKLLSQHQVKFVGLCRCLFSRSLHCPYQVFLVPQL